MSLLLSSLKKADEENRQAEQPAAAAKTAPAAESAAADAGAAGSASSAVASAGSSLNIQKSGGAIDFDSVGAEGAAGGGQESGDERLVSASRVFRAGEDAEAAGGGRRVVVGMLALFLVLGGGIGVVSSGLIPGLSVTSIMQVFGVGAAPQFVQKRDTGPVLEAIGGENAALSIPRPLVDVQSGIAGFAAFRNEDGALDTPQGRQELASKIAGFVGEAEEEDIAEEDDLQIIGLELDEQEFLPEEDVAEEVVIKTADSSRDFKLSLDTRTPSDRVLSRAVTRNSAGIVVAQASEDEASEEAPAAAESDVAASDVAEEEKGIQVKPSLSGADRRRMLNEAGRLYVGGSYPEAEAAYRNILSKNATNLDALRGLALVAVATGRYQLAVATYLKILEYYPNDPVAVADMTNLHGVSGDNFYEIESALKKVIGKHPEWDSRLYFALGNLYAGAERWTDAQKSYFNAYSGEQTNPDYAYNLAVVLDYLNKPALALAYYREALELSARAPSGFDAGIVRARIADISQ